jgi:hypothetical protein
VLFPKLPKNSIYLELLGAGVLYSINYERILFEKNRSLFSARIGFSAYFISSPNSRLIIPFGLNYQIRISKSIGFEIGGAYRFVLGSVIGNTGFRFLIKNKLLFKINFTPQLYDPLGNGTGHILTWGSHNSNFVPYFGFSMGFSFGKKNGMESKKAKEGSYNFSPKNSIYTELLGSGILGSVNYERFFLLNNHNGINARIGLGKTNVNPQYDKYYTIPIGINYQYLFNKMISFETGIGYTYFPQRKNYDDNQINGNVGFRFLLKNHLLFKINYTPQFSSKLEFVNMSKDFKYGTWIGISMGFSFGKKN